MPPTLTDQVNELRTVIGKTHDELKGEIHDQGEELKTSLGEFREDFAGFRARMDILIDEVPKIRDEFQKTRDDFLDFRSSIKTYLVVAKWAVGILSALTIWMIKSSYDLTWNASRVHSDVAQHGKQIGDLTTVIEKLEERQRPLAALPEILKSLEDTVKANERLLARLDHLEKGLQPLMAITSEHIWKVVITEEDRIRDPAGAGGSESDPFPPNPNRPPDATSRTLDFEVSLPASTTPPQSGTLLEPTFQPLPSSLIRSIELAEAIVIKGHLARIRIRFDKPESRQRFQQYLSQERHLSLDLKSPRVQKP